MSYRYILKGKTPVPILDIRAWGRWFEQAERHVAQEMIGDVRVSTVFLGVDHNFGEGPPLLFETMIFGGPLDGYQERCSTWEQAEDMHAKAISLVMS